MSGVHQPVAGTWLCTACWLPWPCQTRRRQLLAHYDGAPVSLALVLSAAMVEAADDLRGVPAGELHDQFVGWLPRPTSSQRRAALASPPIPT